MADRILVTGISGFVGGSLGRYLRERRGAHVTGSSRSPPREAACDAFVSHDLAAPLPNDAGSFDAIVHCAALASPWASPADYERSNVCTLQTILDFAKRTRPRHFIFVSSSAVHYAYCDQEGVSEETPWPKRPVNLYSASKRKGEALVRDACDAAGIAWTIVRPRAVFGPGDTVVFPRILRAAKEGALPRLARSDGKSPRACLLYIENLCFFLERVLTTGADGVFLLTNNEPIETQAMLDDVLARLGLPIPARRMPVPIAMAAAGAMETVSRLARNWREPAATRFGVASLAFSKTFDVSRAIGRLGHPPVSMQRGLDAFIAWQKPRLAL
jgi:nucleoside-diphosphate-sugar epimerase